MGKHICRVWEVIQRRELRRHPRAWGMRGSGIRRLESNRWIIRMLRMGETRSQLGNRIHYRH